MAEGRRQAKHPRNLRGRGGRRKAAAPGGSKGARRQGARTAPGAGGRRLRLWPAHPLQVLRPVVLALVSAAVLAGAWRLFDVPVTRVTMEGPFRRVSDGQVEAIVRAHLPAGFLSTDLAALRAQIEAVPWVDVARVRRVWPDTIVVHITEHVAVARWGEGGLLNARGELFVTDTPFVLPELAHLTGPPGTEEEVAQRYLDWDRQVQRLGLRLLALSVDARGAWNVRLRGGDTGPVEVRLGRRDPDARLRRFAETASRLVQAQGDRIEYVDMRYGNGFAVGWHASSVAESAGPAHRSGHGTES